MLEYFKLYLPLSKREIKLSISAPRNKEGITFETLYFLDGQNAFKDSNASYGRSIRATKYLNILGKEYHKRILGVGIYNSESEMGRINEYSPFKITNKGNNPWFNDPNICKNFCEDFINTIIPFIEKKYNTYKDNSHRYIYGSSLAATTALYMLGKYDAFSYAGCFSSACFLFEKEYFKFLKSSDFTNKNVFLYIGRKESSDEIFTSDIYYNGTIKLYEFFKKNNINTKLVISINGYHNEECWDHHFLSFISFIYSKDMELTF